MHRTRRVVEAMSASSYFSCERLECFKVARVDVEVMGEESGARAQGTRSTLPKRNQYWMEWIGKTRDRTVDSSIFPPCKDPADDVALDLGLRRHLRPVDFPLSWI